MLEIIRHRLPRNLGRSAEADDLLRRLCTRPQTALLATAVEDRFHLHAGPVCDVKRTDTFGTIDLVRRHRHQVDGQLAEVDRKLANGLGRVDVKDDVSRTAQLADSIDVLDDACLVVEVHDGDELRVVSQRSFQRYDIEHSAAAGLEPGNLESFPDQLAERIGDGLVFGAHTDQMPATILAVTCGADDREVVRFGRTGRPDEPAGLRVQQCGQLPGRVFDRGNCPPAFGMRR